MSNFVKKIVATATALTCAVMMLAPVGVHALTAEELQEQINDLMATLTALQGQLALLEGEDVVVTIEGIPAGFTFENALKIGMSSDECKYLQIVLNSDSETRLAATGVGSPGSETSYFGPLTKGAVVKFQDKYAEEVLAYWGLTAGTGFVGSTTRDKLNDLLGAVPVTPTGCECTTWADDVCGGGDCSATQMNQTRTCEPEEGAETDVCEGVAVSQCVTDTSCEVSVTETTVSLAVGTPAATHKAYSSQDVPFTKVKFTGGTEGVTITKIVIARGGVSADADLASIKLYDGITQLGSTQALNTLTHKAGFSGLSWEIPAGETKYLTVKGSINQSGTGYATAGDLLKLGIVSVSDITSSVTLTGTFPIWGNSVTIAGISVGTFDVDVQTSPATNTNMLSGAVDQGIASWKFTATDEGFSIHSIKLTHTGSATKDDVKNIKLKVSGVQVGETIATMDASNQAVFDLSASPISVNSGSSKTVYAYADIADGIWTSRTVIFEITQYTDVTAYGANTGGIVTVTYTSGSTSGTSYVKQTGNTMTIGQGDLTVALDASQNPSSQNYVKGTEDRLMTALKFTTGSQEGVRVVKIKLTLGGTDVAATDISNVTLWDGTTQIAGPASVIGSYVTFGASTIGWDTSKIIDIEKSTVKTLLVKADIPTGANAAHTVSLSIDSNSNVWADGLDSRYDVPSSAITASATGNAHEIDSSGALTVSLSASTPPAQNYVIGATTQEFSRINLAAGSGEDISVTAITVRCYAAAGVGTDCSSTAKLTNMKLYYYDSSASTWVQYGTTVSSPLASASFSGNLTVSASETVALKVIADVPTSSYPSNVHIDLPGGGTLVDDVDSTGVYSSATITETGSATGKTMAIGSGTLTVAASASPGDQTIIIGATDASFANLILTAGTKENIRITKIRLTQSTSAYGSTTDMSNIALYDGSTRLTTKKSLTLSGATEVSGVNQNYVEFSASAFLNSLGIDMDKGTQKTIAVKGDIPATGIADNIVALGVSTTAHITFTGMDSNISDTAPTLNFGSNLKGVNYHYSGHADVQQITLKASGAFSEISLAADTPVIDIQAVGTQDGTPVENVGFTKIKIISDGREAIDIKNITVQLATGTDRQSGFALISLWDGSTQLLGDQQLDLDSNVPATASTTFNFPTGSYWRVSGTKYLTVKADLNGVKGYYTSEGARTGDAPQLCIATDGTNYKITGQGASSGVDITYTGAADLCGRIQYVRQSKPVLAAASLPSTVLTTGEKVLYRWTVTADNQGAIGWRRVAFNITGAFTVDSTSRAINATTGDSATSHTDGVYVTNSGYLTGHTKVINAFKVWNLTDNVQVTATTTDVAGTALLSTVGAFIRCDSGANAGEYIVFVAGTEEEIAASATKTYELRGTVLVAPSTGDNVLVKLADLSTTATTGAYAIADRNAVNFNREDIAVIGTGLAANAVATTASTTLSFIWTDRSAASGSVVHSLATADWTNDYKVEGIPTATLSLQK